MAKRTGMEVSLAVSEAVKMAKTDVIAAYPITPQTHIVEHLADLVANGELDAEYIPVESEHSAMSACLGSSATGARTFTATAGQGLELMHEVVYVASCHASAHRDGGYQPRPIGSFERLGRSFGCDGCARYRLDSDICGKRPGSN